MSIKFSYKFPGIFRFHEEHLCKLDEIVCKRIPGGIRYSFDFDGGISRSLDNLGDLFSEHTAYQHRIISLSGATPYGIDDLKFSIHFYGDREFSESVWLNVEADDLKKDVAHLLFDEVKGYVSTHIMHKRYFPRILFLFVAFCVFLQISMVTLGILNTFSNPGSQIERYNLLDRAIESEDLLESFNLYLRYVRGPYQADAMSDQYGDQIFPLIIVILASAGVMLSGFGVFSQINRYLNPRNVVVIGCYKSRYEEIVRLRRNIIWTVVIGSAISVVTGLAISRFP